jgi:holo-[acyl-carrier protein] synthase
VLTEPPDEALKVDALEGTGKVQCGVDLVEIARISRAVERWGQRFLRRVWTERELALCRGRLPELAARFAAKEAVSKALGTGMADGITWLDIEVLSDLSGKPVLYLHGEARRRAARLGLDSWAISLSHSAHLACAFVVALSGDPPAIADTGISSITSSNM